LSFPIKFSIATTALVIRSLAQPRFLTLDHILSLSASTHSLRHKSKSFQSKDLHRNSPNITAGNPSIANIIEHINFKKNGDHQICINNLSIHVLESEEHVMIRIFTLYHILSLSDLCIQQDIIHLASIEGPS
jgi:hypothetical protein